MRTLTVSLTPRQARRMQQAVEEGSYASNSEVVRDALRLWEQREDLRAMEMGRLKQAYDEGMASGEGRHVEPADFLAALKADQRRRG
ncbi:MAG: type II toxin-antitoxin system ParD family antitoxin [Mesorhizobium sp.]